MFCYRKNDVRHRRNDVALRANYDNANAIFNSEFKRSAIASFRKGGLIADEQSEDGMVDFKSPSLRHVRSLRRSPFARSLRSLKGAIHSRSAPLSFRIPHSLRGIVRLLSPRRLSLSLLRHFRVLPCSLPTPQRICNSSGTPTAATRSAIVIAFAGESVHRVLRLNACLQVPKRNVLPPHLRSHSGIPI